MLVCRFSPLQSSWQLSDACHSVAKNSVQPDCGFTQYISRCIVQVSAICFHIIICPRPWCYIADIVGWDVTVAAKANYRLTVNERSTLYVTQVMSVRNEWESVWSESMIVLCVTRNSRHRCTYQPDWAALKPCSCYYTTEPHVTQQPRIFTPRCMLPSRRVTKISLRFCSTVELNTTPSHG